MERGFRQGSASLFCCTLLKEVNLRQKDSNNPSPGANAPYRSGKFGSPSEEFASPGAPV